MKRVLIFWLLLIAVPACAMIHHSLWWKYNWALYYLMGVQMITVSLYAWDKRCAKRGKQRIAEWQLLSLDLLGGWPSSFWAQRFFRHKISKKSYQATYFLIIFLHLAFWSFVCWGGGR